MKISYKKFLKVLESSDFLDKSPYIRVPKKLIADPKLTPNEKVTLIILSGFQYNSGQGVYPSRQTIAGLLGIKNVNNVSKYTRSLQKKGYLAKAYDKGNRAHYMVYFEDETDDSFFFGEAKHQRELRMSRHNNIHNKPSQGETPKIDTS